MSCSTCRGFSIKIIKKQLALAESSFLKTITEEINSSGNSKNISDCLREMTEAFLSPNNNPKVIEDISKKYISSHKQKIEFDLDAGISPNLMKKIAAYEESLEKQGIDLDQEDLKKVQSLLKKFYKSLPAQEQKEIETKIKNNLLPKINKVGEDYLQIVLMYSIVIISYAKILARITIAGNSLKSATPAPSVGLPDQGGSSTIFQENKISLREIKILVKKINKNILDEALQFKSARQIFEELLDKFKIKNISIRDLIRHIDDSYDQIKASKEAATLLRQIIENINIKINTRKVDLQATTDFLSSMSNAIKSKKASRLRIIDREIERLSKERFGPAIRYDKAVTDRIDAQKARLEGLKTRQSTTADELDIQKIDAEIEQLEAKLANEQGIIKARADAIQTDIDKLKVKNAQIESDLKNLEAPSGKAPKPNSKINPNLKGASYAFLSFYGGNIAGNLTCSLFGLFGTAGFLYIKNALESSKIISYFSGFFLIPYSAFTVWRAGRIAQDPSRGKKFGYIGLATLGLGLGCYTGLKNALAANEAKLDKQIEASEFFNSAVRKMGLAIGKKPEEVEKKYVLLIKDPSKFDMFLNALNPYYDYNAYGDMAELVTRNFPSIFAIVQTGGEVALGTVDALTFFNDTAKELKEKVDKFTQYAKEKLKTKVPSKFIDIYNLYTQILINSGITEPILIKKITSCAIKDAFTDSINNKNSQSIMLILDILQISEEAKRQPSNVVNEFARQERQEEVLNKIEEKINIFNTAISELSRDTEGKIKYFGLDDNLQNFRDDVTKLYGAMKRQSAEQTATAETNLKKRWNEINKIIEEAQQEAKKQRLEAENYRKAASDAFNDDKVRYNTNMAKLSEAKAKFYDKKIKFYKSLIGDHDDYKKFLVDVKNKFTSGLKSQYNKESIAEKDCDSIKREYKVAYKTFKGFFVKKYEEGGYLIKLNKNIDLRNPNLLRIVKYSDDKKTIKVVDEDDPTTEETYTDAKFDLFLKQTIYYGKI